MRVSIVEPVSGGTPGPGPISCWREIQCRAAVEIRFIDAGFDTDVA